MYIVADFLTIKLGLGNALCANNVPSYGLENWNSRLGFENFIPTFDLVAATTPTDKVLDPSGLSRMPYEFLNHSWNGTGLIPPKEAFSRAPGMGHEGSASLRRLEGFASIKQVKGRRGPLDPDSKKSARYTRKIGACYPCRREQMKVIGLPNFEENYYSYEEI